MQKENPSPNSSTSATKPKPKRKLRKVAIIGGISLATLGVGYLLWRHFKPTEMESDDFSPSRDVSLPDVPTHHLPAIHVPNSHTPTPQSSTPEYRPDTSFPLSIYMKGEKVKMIQKALNHQFKSGLDVDGFWGTDTETALKKNGQPNVISQAQYGYLLAEMKKRGLAGLSGNLGKMAITNQPCTAQTEGGDIARLPQGWLAGSVVAEQGDLVKILTSANNYITIRRGNLIFA